MDRTALPTGGSAQCSSQICSLPTGPHSLSSLHAWHRSRTAKCCNQPRITTYLPEITFLPTIYTPNSGLLLLALGFLLLFFKFLKKVQGPFCFPANIRINNLPCQLRTIWKMHIDKHTSVSSQPALPDGFADSTFVDFATRSILIYALLPNPPPHVSRAPSA